MGDLNRPFDIDSENSVNWWTFFSSSQPLHLSFSSEDPKNVAIASQLIKLVGFVISIEWRWRISIMRSHRMWCVRLIELISFRIWIVIHLMLIPHSHSPKLSSRFWWKFSSIDWLEHIRWISYFAAAESLACMWQATSDVVSTVYAIHCSLEICRRHFGSRHLF